MICYAKAARRGGAPPRTRTRNEFPTGAAVWRGLAREEYCNATVSRKGARSRPLVPRAGIPGDVRAKEGQFECGVADAKVAEQADFTKSWEYREKNFARESLVVNPAKACQPLGAVFVAAGFEKTMSFVHGSQGCVAYYRSHLSRHFKEPCRRCRHR